MSSLDEKVALYSKVLSEKCGIKPNAELLRAVTKAMGPSIYRDDAETVAASDNDEANTFKNNFIMKKLGITDQSQADAAFNKAIEKIGKSNPRKYRAVLAYLVVEDLGKQNIFA